MESRSSTQAVLPRGPARCDFSSTISTLFGLEASAENKRSGSVIRLPDQYKTALAAEAVRFRPRRIVRSDFASTISTLFGSETSPENKRRSPGVQLPERYKSALAAEAVLFKPRCFRRSPYRPRKPVSRPPQEPAPIAKADEAYPPWTELVSPHRTNLEQSGFIETTEYGAIFGRNGMVEQAKAQLFEARFSPRKAPALPTHGTQRSPATSA